MRSSKVWLNLVDSKWKKASIWKPWRRWSLIRGLILSNFSWRHSSRWRKKREENWRPREMLRTSRARIKACKNSSLMGWCIWSNRISSLASNRRLRSSSVTLTGRIEREFSDFFSQKWTPVRVQVTGETKMKKPREAAPRILQLPSLIKVSVNKKAKKITEMNRMLKYLLRLLYQRTDRGHRSTMTKKISLINNEFTLI